MHIRITKTAEKKIKRLDKAIKTRILSAIKKLPEGDIKKLKGLENSYRLRVGDYRILYKSDGITITITDALPRGEAYKRL